MGDDNLLDLINNLNDNNIVKEYKKVLNHLIKFQTEGIIGLDLDVAYPVKEFNFESIMWDLNYFKYLHELLDNKGHLLTSVLKVAKTGREYFSEKQTISNFIKKINCITIAYFDQTHICVSVYNKTSHWSLSIAKKTNNQKNYN